MSTMPYLKDRYKCIVGFSDHTIGNVAAIGSICYGATVIEKHFTDSIDRVGPDHSFSMTPTSFREMVERTRELQASLGDGVKKVEENEQENVNGIATNAKQRTARLYKQ